MHVMEKVVVSGSRDRGISVWSIDQVAIFSLIDQVAIFTLTDQVIIVVIATRCWLEVMRTASPA